MTTGQEFETQRIDHFGIVSGISREMGLVAEIDCIVGPVERKVSCGEAVLAIVLKRTGF